MKPAATFSSIFLTLLLLNACEKENPNQGTQILTNILQGDFEVSDSDGTFRARFTYAYLDSTANQYINLLQLEIYPDSYFTYEVRYDPNLGIYNLILEWFNGSPYQTFELRNIEFDQNLIRGCDLVGPTETSKLTKI